MRKSSFCTNASGIALIMYSISPVATNRVKELWKAYYGTDDAMKTEKILFELGAEIQKIITAIKTTETDIFVRPHSIFVQPHNNKLSQIQCNLYKEAAKVLSRFGTKRFMAVMKVLASMTVETILTTQVGRP